jgi:hypothetical protein
LKARLYRISRFWLACVTLVLILILSEGLPIVKANDSFSSPESTRRFEIQFDQSFPSEWVSYVRDLYHLAYSELENFCGYPIRSGTLLVRFDTDRPYLYCDWKRKAVICGRLPKPPQGQQRDMWWDLNFLEVVSQLFCVPLDLFANWAWGIHRAVANLVVMSLVQKGKLSVEFPNWIYSVTTYDAFSYLGGDVVAGSTWGSKASGSPFWSLREGMFLMLTFSFPSKKTGQFDYLARVFASIRDNILYHKRLDLGVESYFYVSRDFFDTALGEAAEGQRIDGLTPSEWVRRQPVTLEKGTSGPHIGVYIDDVDNPWRVSVFAFNRRFNPKNPREGFEDPLKNSFVWVKVVDWKGELVYFGNVTTGDDGRAYVRPKWKLAEGGYAITAEANYEGARLSSKGYAIGLGQQAGIREPSKKMVGIVLDEEGEPISGSIKTSSGRVEFCRNGIFSIDVNDVSNAFEISCSSNNDEKRFTKPAVCLRVVSITGLGVGSDLRCTFYGKVTDADTGLPLLGAEVKIYRNETQKDLTTTDSEGKYRVGVRGEGKYTIFVFHSAGTNDAGYVPGAYAVEAKARTNSVNFRLYRGALIILNKQLDLFDMTRTRSMNFTVLDERSGRALDLNGTLCTYGDAVRFLGLNVRHIKVPAGRGIRLKVDVVGTFEEMRMPGVRITQVVSKSFETEETFYLRSGEEMRLDLRRLSMVFNLRSLSTVVTKVTELLQQAENYGFYVVSEKKDLSAVNKLGSSAIEKLREGKFDEGFSDAKEGYIKASYLLNSVLMTFSESYWSAEALVFFLAFCSSALAAFIFDRSATKLVGFIGAYLAMWLWFYSVFPGCKVVPLPMLLSSSAMAFAGSAVLTLALPATLGRARGSIAHISTLFSLAKRNLRRRRLRTALLTSTMMTLVLAFVALTSFSVEYGLEIKTVSGASSSDGVLIRENPSFDARFGTLAELKGDVRQWISEKEGVVEVIPKLESMPEIRIYQVKGYYSYNYLGRLINHATNTSMSLLGALAFQPTKEPLISQIQAAVADGRVFSENEKAVMISLDAARKNSFQVGEELTLTLVANDGSAHNTRVILVGLLDDSRLRAINDLDGHPILPQVVKRVIEENIVVDDLNYCEPTAIVLMSTTTANYFPGALSTSRLSVMLDRVERVPVLARAIALARDMWTWASAGGRIQSMHLASYVETRGGFLVVPLVLVALNLGAAIYMAISERKHETSTLSTLGVSPADITRLFIGEAVFIALLGAGIGYLSGLSFYKLVSLFLLNPEVRQKVSAAWSIVVVVLAIAVSLVGAHVPSKRAALFSTPMGLARWKMDETYLENEGWRIRLPLKVETRELNGFVGYIFGRLEKLRDGTADHVERLEMKEEDSDSIISRGIAFRFLFLGRGELRSSFGTSGFFIAPSILTVAGRHKGPLDVELSCRVPRESKAVAYQVADLIRKMALDWTTQKEKMNSSGSH